ncbi:MAG: hypothetical protein A2157_19215 [Deltaproteobacteria bacterium RBG_16_47_11]|nr:MAG: hypothetical protein A2157_19215 [Deltaproteobacteria bacterium RBG_16_47_11]
MADIYDGLSKGVIDAASSVMAFTWSMKFYEVAPYITWSNSTGMVTATTMLINLDRWNKFPQSLQSIIDKIALEYNDRLAQILITNEENYLKEMTTKYNVKFHKFSPEEDARLSECAKKAQEEWFANPKHKGVPVRAVWDRFQALVKKYDAEVATKGYPWKRR